MSRIAELSVIILRDIDRLADEVRAYPSDDAVWASPEGIHNPGGTLAIHLAGNLQHFIGAVLGDSGYVREREREFGARGLTREEILGEIADARTAVDAAFATLSDARLDEVWTGGGPLGDTATVGPKATFGTISSGGLY